VCLQNIFCGVGRVNIPCRDPDDQIERGLIDWLAVSISHRLKALSKRTGIRVTMQQRSDCRLRVFRPGKNQIDLKEFLSVRRLNERAYTELACNSQHYLEYFQNTSAVTCISIITPAGRGATLMYLHFLDFK
jgi:hypothetical protein